MPTNNHQTQRPALVLVDDPSDTSSELAARLSAVRQRHPDAGQHAPAGVIDLTPQTSARRRFRFPVLVSVLITVGAQAVLAAVIASQQLDPILGALAALGLAVGGLALIVAEAISIVTRRN